MRKLIDEYGSDFSYFKQFLPHKTRKQIQRKYDAIVKRDHQIREQRLKMERQIERKNRFDIELFESSRSAISS